MSSIFCFINITEIYNSYKLHKKLSKNLEEPVRHLASFLNLKLLSPLLDLINEGCTYSLLGLNRFPMLPLVVHLAVIHCHLSSFVVTRCPSVCCLSPCHQKSNH